MGKVATYLNNILSARYGKDVRQSIHDAIEELNAVAVTAQGSALKSAQTASDKATEANTSKTSAAASAKAAEAAANRAAAVSGVGVASETVAGLMAGGENGVFSGVLTLTKTTTQTELEKPVSGGIIVNEIQGNTIQDSIPTPEVPQEIKNVKVSEIKTNGKNLWPFGNVSGTLNAAKGYKLKPGVYTFSATITSNDTNDTTSLIQVLYEDDTTLSMFLSRNSRTSKTVTLAKKTKSIILYAATTWNNSKDDMFDFKDIQIEKGSAMTGYEPYQETKATLSAPVSLHSVGNVKDVFCKQDGVYGTLKRFNTKTVTTVNNVQSIEGTNITCNNSSLFSDRKAGRNYLSNRFAVLSSQAEGSTKEGMIFNTTEANKRYLYLYMSKDRLTVSTETTEEYRKAINEWLASNNLEIIYELETPVFEPLPEADQIALHQLESFDGVTYMLTDSAVEPVIELEYPTSKVGGYAIRGMNLGEVNAIRYKSLSAAVLALNQE